MAFMQLVMTISLGAGIWVSVLLLVISLCKAAKAGDEALDAGYVTAEESGWQEVKDSRQVNDGIAPAAIEVDLRAHPRPTRGAFDRRTPPEHPTEPMPRQLLGPSEAADTLGVTPEVLLAWEGRYGYPKAHHPSAAPGRAYRRAEVLALAESLRNGLSIASAINAAQAATSRRRASAGRKRQPPTSGAQ
jgi:hypothetical protein